MQYHIYWLPQSRLLELQGAKVEFRALNNVYYENKFLPSGQVVAKWSSKNNYSRTKQLADLPILKREQTYELERHIEDSEHMFGYLSVTFYDRYQRRLAVFSQNVSVLEFKVPKDYDYYEIELIVAGADAILFHDFVIRPKVENGTLIANDEVQRFETGEQLYTYLQHAEMVTTKTLRVIFTEPAENVLELPVAQGTTPEQNVLYIADGRPLAGFYRQNAGSEIDDYESSLIAVIKDAQQASRAKRIELVGYGPVSSYAAVYYANLLDNDVVGIWISRDIAKTPKDWINQQPKTQFMQAMTGQVWPEAVAVDDNQVTYLNQAQSSDVTGIPQLHNPVPVRLEQLPVEAGEVAPLEFKTETKHKPHFWQHLFGKKHQQ
jgi:accessory secretory protein Asp3